MAGCCGEDELQLERMRNQQARMLWAVLVINSVMFLVEFGAGWLAASTALLADSLDMLGDSLVYGLSLFVVSKGMRWKALSAGFKGFIMLGFGLLVLGEAVAKVVVGHAPQPGMMGAVGLLALMANISCLVLLTRHHEDDVNIRSAWVCSRNDLVANAGVLIAAVLVALTGGLWPDVAIGVVIAGLFIYTSIGVLRDARANFSRPDPVAANELRPGRANRVRSP